MVRQYDAQQISDNLLKEHGLYAKGWRTVFCKDERFLGRCYHDEKRIQLSLLGLNSHNEFEVKNTILHEIAHALVGVGKGHNFEWLDMARKLGLKETTPCIHVNFDAGRSIQPSESKSKRTIKALQNTCPICGKVAIEKSSLVLGKTRWIKLECSHIVKHDQIKKSESYIGWTSESGKQIFKFQEKGIEFLEAASGRALIADEPGLGKTIQALGFCFFHTDEVCPVLWVCKSTLKLQAIKEALDWCGPGWMGQIIDSSRAFIIPNLKLYVISMDLLRNMPTDKLEKIGYKTVVADEIQHFKNPDSTRTSELRKLVKSADYFIALSGTPWKNRGQEYFPVLNMLTPERFPSYKHFQSNWVDWYVDPKTFKTKQGGIRNIPRFREYTKDIIIRRLRDDVLPDLPKINRQVRFVDMEELYEKAYEKSEIEIAAIIKDAILDGKGLQSIASQIMKLKHITGLAKVQTCIDDITEWLEQTEDWEKLTIFHHHIDVGDNLQNGDGTIYEGLDSWLIKNGYNKSLRLFGGRSPEERNRVIESFKLDVKNRVLIASTLASGEGLNIQFCQNAMMLERQWNPANEEQAELRFSRPITKGDLPEYLQHLAHDENKVSIKVPYFIAAGTIDEMLTDLIEKKRYFFKKTMNDKDADIQWNESEIIKELAEMILKKRYKKVS